ncbi:unnamed protein product [Malus baccata var. baccata]
MIMANYFTAGALAIAHTNFSTDQSALLALKAHITSDPQNILTANWSSASNSNICNWIGVTCGARHHRLTALNLSHMGLVGVIPPHLGNLSFLVELDLGNNFFNGPLPQELSRLRRLKAIHFGYNNFTGTIPSWFGSFAALQKIGLYELPNEMGSLDQLEVLHAESNALKGSALVPVLNISSLTTLDLYGNNMSGSLPDNICEHLPSIREFRLGKNQFDGLIPSKLWQCKELRVLQLEVNNFRGSIPKSLGNLTYLTEIYLDHNNLTALSCLFNLRNLIYLDLGDNPLNTTIPASHGNLSLYVTPIC